MDIYDNDSWLNSEYNQTNVDWIDNETLHRGFIHLKKYRLKYQYHDGSWSEEITRELIHKPEVAAILPINFATKEIVFIEQFRAGLMHESSPWEVEIPAGINDQNQSIDDLAKRELTEETGLIADTLIPMLNYYSSPGATDEKVHLFYTSIDTSTIATTAGNRYEHEDILIKVVSIEQALTALDNNQITNAITLIALQWLQKNLAQLFEKHT